jgi:DNA polymerase-3 subunit epsilon
MYAIVDVETTGLSAERERITEISIIQHDGQQVTDVFTTLLNPEKRIPYRIAQLTGINDKMVAHAPRFFEVAKKIIEMTENRILVGHNVAFDYRFIRSEFRQFGYDFKRQKLCTVKLSRKLIPGQRSYSLGKLTDSLHLNHDSKHRAEGDAMATARLFELLLSINPNPDIPGKEELSTHLSREKINSLPEATGVYYFYNENHDLIYIGKSKNISERVYQHLTNNSTKRALEMRQEIQDVDYEITGSELVALLKESAEIKEHQPRFNRAQRRTSYLWGIYSFIDQNGYINLKTARTNKLNETPLASFASKTAAQEFMHQLTRQHMLCQKLTGLYKTEGACFQYQIHQCRGACVGEERPETYNERLKQALERFDFEHSNFIAIDMGRRIDERAVVVVEKGLFKGYGFFDVEALNNGTDFIRENVKFQRHTRDAKQIIQSYLQHQKVERVIAF